MIHDMHVMTLRVPFLLHTPFFVLFLVSFQEHLEFLQSLHGCTIPRVTPTPSVPHPHPVYHTQYTTPTPSIPHPLAVSLTASHTACQLCLHPAQQVLCLVPYQPLKLFVNSQFAQWGISLPRTDKLFPKSCCIWEYPGGMVESLHAAKVHTVCS